jgi:RNA polymerase sigma-70 factor (ECF subfamily)
VWDVSDEALLAGYASGDRDAAVMFVRRFGHRVFGLALMLTRDRDVADEVAQDAFLRAWRYGEGYDPRRGSVLGWLLAIVRNVALDHQRVNGRRSEGTLPDLPSFDLLVDDADDIADVAAQHDHEAHVLAAMRTLPREQQEAVAAVTLYGLSGREYSEAAQIPLGTVKTRIRLGLRRLRDELGVLTP